MNVHALGDQIRKIFEVHGGEMFSHILCAHGAKSPIEVGQLFKAAGFGQEVALANTMGECGVMSLEEKDYLVDGMNIFVPEGHHPCGIGRKDDIGLVDPVKKILQALAAEQSDCDFDTQVALEGGDVLGVQETFQVGGGRVGRVKLGERRRNQEHGNTQGDEIWGKIKAKWRLD